MLLTSPLTDNMHCIQLYYLKLSELCITIFLQILQTMYLILVERSGAEDGLSSVEIMFYNSVLSLPFLLFLIIATGEFPNSVVMLFAKVAIKPYQIFFGSNAKTRNNLTLVFLSCLNANSILLDLTSNLFLWAE